MAWRWTPLAFSLLACSKHQPVPGPAPHEVLAVAGCYSLSAVGSTDLGQPVPPELELTSIRLIGDNPSWRALVRSDAGVEADGVGLDGLTQSQFGVKIETGH